MLIFNEYNDILCKCPFCRQHKGRVIQSKKRSGKNRKYFPAYKVICFNCWASTASYFMINDAIFMWNISKDKD